MVSFARGSRPILFSALVCRACILFRFEFFILILVLLFLSFDSDAIPSPGTDTAAVNKLRVEFPAAVPPLWPKILFGARGAKRERGPRVRGDRDGANGSIGIDWYGLEGYSLTHMACYEPTSLSVRPPIGSSTEFSGCHFSEASLHNFTGQVAKVRIVLWGKGSIPERQL